MSRDNERGPAGSRLPLLRAGTPALDRAVHDRQSRPAREAFESGSASHCQGFCDRTTRWSARLLRMHCSVAPVPPAVGEWWSLLIVRDAFLRVSRFGEFQQRLGISRGVLNQPPGPACRGRRAGEGAVQRATTAVRLSPDREGTRPVAGRHSACDSGVTSTPPRKAHRSADPRALRRDLRGPLVCSACGEPFGPLDFKPIPGPGAVEPLVRVA